MSGIIGGVGSKSGVIGTTELDYEEGEWTPTQGNFGTWTSPTFVGTYTKIGRVVSVFCRQSGGTIDPGDVTKYMAGLPFISGTTGTTGVMTDSNLVANVRIHLGSGTGNFYFIEDMGPETNINFSFTYST